MDVFSEATTLLKGRSGYTIKIVALSMEPVTALNGTRFLPDMSIEETLEGFDTLVIAGSPGVRKYEDHRELVEWIIRESRHVRRLASICTGAFLLGKAGLLNGRRATTHWNSTSRLAEMFPKVRLDRIPYSSKTGPSTQALASLRAWILRLPLSRKTSVAALLCG
ncbi:DJ-1/PfpI family protein (plasmid) [Rhizobium sp. T1473]|uniref:DJ-1/PfpI family protein n=2 Tax=unclassified Rhizobium TaxID=2613769 RepID=UPI0030D62326